METPMPRSRLPVQRPIPSRPRDAATRGAVLPRRAFSLIELLIVVSIIAILALVAIPNFIEARTRSSVSRARADLRAIASALEAYFVDYNDHPPNDGDANVVPNQLSTPVAFITEARLIDPFKVGVERHNTVIGPVDRYYTYTKVVDVDEAARMAIAGLPCPYEAIDDPFFNWRAFERYGLWRLVCVGPDLTYASDDFPPPLRGSDLLYDPTNGVASFGNILRTQKDPDGRRATPHW